MKANDKCDDSFCTFTNPFIREKLKILDMKLIDLYKEWMEAGELPDWGLCCSLDDEYYNMLDILFTPTQNEFEVMRNKGLSRAYWASGLSCTDLNIYTKFTPLRQTIVLLICAMNNEL